MSNSVIMQRGNGELKLDTELHVELCDHGAASHHFMGHKCQYRGYTSWIEEHCTLYASINLPESINFHLHA